MHLYADIKNLGSRFSASNPGPLTRLVHIWQPWDGNPHVTFPGMGYSRMTFDEARSEGRSL